jgi:hypothetical protein
VNEKRRISFVCIVGCETTLNEKELAFLSIIVLE